MGLSEMSRSQAIRAILRYHYGEVGDLRLQVELRDRGFNLDGLDEELQRLNDEGCVALTPLTVRLGPRWGGGPKPKGLGRPQSNQFHPRR